MRNNVARTLDRSIQVLDRASQIAVWIGGMLLLASAFMIGAEVILRRFFGVTTRGADEFSYYVFAISSSWAFTFTLLRKAHIRIDVVYLRFGSTVRSVLDIIALTSLGTFSALATYAMLFGLLRRTIERGTVSNTAWQTPLWIPQGLWALGFVLFSLTILVLLLRVLWGLLIERDPATVDRHAGSQKLDEEIEEALTTAEAAEKGRTA